MKIYKSDMVYNTVIIFRKLKNTQLEKKQTFQEMLDMSESLARFAKNPEQEKRMNMRSEKIREAAKKTERKS